MMPVPRPVPKAVRTAVYGLFMFGTAGLIFLALYGRDEWRRIRAHRRRANDEDDEQQQEAPTR